MKKSSIMILRIGILLIIAIYVVKFKNTYGIIPVEATLVESSQCYTKDHKTHREIGGENKYVRVIEVYQHMVLKYQLNGETVTKDVGEIKVEEVVEENTSPYISEQEYIDMYKYDIGETISVYVLDNGSVYMASDLNDTNDESNWMMIGMTVFWIYVIFNNRTKKNKKRDKNDAA